jgi:hypothetical protein
MEIGGMPLGRQYLMTAAFQDQWVIRQAITLIGMGWGTWNNKQSSIFTYLDKVVRGGMSGASATQDLLKLLDPNRPSLTWSA